LMRGTRRRWQHNAFAMSAALAFQTIFALIPVLVLTALVLTSIGAIGDSKAALRDFMKQVGVSQIQVTETAPATQPGAATQTIMLSDKIEEMFDALQSKITVGRLGPVGVVLLIWSAIALLTTMEQSLNRIFGVEQNRSIPRRLFLYWAAMTLVPLILLAVGYASRTALEHARHIWGVSWLLAHVALWLGTPMVGILLLAALYKFLPNTNVPYRTAFIGAVLAAPLWMVARWGFGLYVEHAAKGNFYGALGLIPIFLIWMNVSWLIFLMGAELAYTVANLQRLESAEQDETIIVGPTELLAGAIAVAKPFLAGESPVGITEICRHLQLPDITLRRILQRLQSARIIAPIEEDQETRYVLARPANRIPLFEVMEIENPQVKPELARHFDEDIRRDIQSVYDRVQGSVGNLTLADVAERRQEKLA